MNVEISTPQKKKKPYEKIRISQPAALEISWTDTSRISGGSEQM